MKRESQVEREKRVNDVLAMRLAGARLRDIRQHADKEGWAVTSRTLKRYIQSSDQLILKEAFEDRDKLLAGHIAKRRMLYARCLRMNDLTTALKVLKDEAAILGLYPTEPAAAGPDGRTAILVALLPQLREAMATLAPPSGGEFIVRVAAADACGNLRNESEPVPVVADDRR